MEVARYSGVTKYTVYTPAITAQMSAAHTMNFHPAAR